jgi:hypothetical protein
VLVLVQVLVLVGMLVLVLLSSCALVEIVEIAYLLARLLSIDLPTPEFFLVACNEVLVLIVGTTSNVLSFCSGRRSLGVSPSWPSPESPLLKLGAETHTCSAGLSNGLIHWQPRHSLGLGPLEPLVVRVPTFLLPN